MCEENVTPVSLAKLIAAFAKAKMEMGRLIATETAQVKSEKANYSYRYADLAGVLDVIDKPLASNGLVFVQSPVVEYKAPGAIVTVHGTLYHESGEFLLAAPLVMVSNQTDPQKVGSAITYGRRYQAVAFFGLAQEDDDGKSAGDKPKQTSQAQQQRQTAPQPAQHRQAKGLDTSVMDSLGAELYGEQWPTVRRHNIDRLTNGQPDALTADNVNLMVVGMKDLQKRRKDGGHTNGATKPAAPSPVITKEEIVASDAITLDNVPEASDGHDNPFTPDAAQIHRITEGFNLPKDAWAWAVSNHYTENEHSARNRWSTIVKEEFDNSYTPAKMPAIAAVYVKHYLAKSSAAQTA